MDASAAPSGPPRPVLAFHVGVTGHRALPEADVPGLLNESALLFRSMREEVLRLYAADQASAAPLYRASPPQLRCICGLAEGADSILAEAALAEGWAVVASLPFAREEFEKDFAPGPARDRYHTLLSKSAVVCELDGDRHRAGEPYALVGEQIVEQSDMLVVVWDRLPPRGPGGTGDVVQRAADRGLSIAVLPHAGPVTPAWYGTGKSDIRALVEGALLPAPDRDGFPAAYFQDGGADAGWSARAVRWFEHGLLAGARLSSPAAPQAVSPSPAAEAVLSTYFDAADRIASAYGARYRAAGLMRYGLILPATLGAVLESFDDTRMHIAGAVVQFASLVAVLWFSTRSGWDKIQSRFVAYRALAEHLRSVRLMSPLAALPLPRAVVVHREPIADWTAWYERAVVRDLGLLPQQFDAASMADAKAYVRAKTQEEIAYLIRRAAQFTEIERRLRLIGIVLFGSGIAFETIHFALSLAGSDSVPIVWYNLMSLILPALAPVFLGLLVFGEYARLATRYTALAAELQAQIGALDHAGTQRTQVLPIARRIAQVLLAEGTDWQMLIKARTLSPF